MGGGQDFEKLDQNFKFPQIVTKGKKGEIYIHETFKIKNVHARVSFKISFTVIHG